MICHTDPHLKSDLVRSIIYEANARVQDPVGGCHRIMLRLNHQLRQEQSKLAQVLEQLRIRRREVSNMYNNHQTMMNNQFQEQKPYQDIGQQRICRSQVRNICNDRHPRMNNQSQEQQQHQDIVEAESSRSPVSSNTTNPHPMMNNHIQEQQQYNDIIQEESVGACEAKEPPVRVISDKEQMVPVDSTDATLMLLSGGSFCFQYPYFQCRFVLF